MTGGVRTVGIHVPDIVNFEESYLLLGTCYWSGPKKARARNTKYTEFPTKLCFNFYSNAIKFYLQNVEE